MADFDSSLPVRTQTNGDIVGRLVDGTVNTQFLGIDSSGRVTIKLTDSTGNGVTSQINGTQRALDVGINVAGVQIDPRAIRALTAADVVTAAQGTAAATSGAWPIKVTDGTNTASVKAASTAPVATDQALVVTISPNSIGGSITALQGTSPWVTKDLSDGSVTGGTAGTFSLLAGGVYNTALPTLTTGQQAALQTDSSARLLIGSIASALPTGTNTIGAVNQGNAGTVGQAWFTKVSDGTNTAAVKAASTAAVVADPSLVVQISPNQAPIPVSISADAPGTEINSYNTTASLAAGASSNQDYTVTVAKTFLLTQIEASSSGKMKIEVQIETGAATGVFTSRFVQFNSTAQCNMSIALKAPISVAAGVRVRVIRTNRDLLAQDVYSTISGQETP